MILNFNVTYPDFELGQIIAPDELDVNFADLTIRCNELIDLVNQITDGGASSGADAINVSTIVPFASTTLQTFLQEVVNRLQSNTDGLSGADFVASTLIPGVSGSTIQAQLESLKTLLDSLQTQINTNTANLQTQVTTNANFISGMQAQKSVLDTTIIEANIATTNANTAISNANTEADNAQVQGDYAKTEADRLVATDVSTLQAEVDAHLADYANKFYDNSGAHNSVYRGKYLGASLTSAQQTAISSGTFEDLYIGDYWTIGGINYRIAGFNYFRNVGDTALTANHVTIVPDTVLYNAQMNATNVTTGGYVNSEMRTTNLASAITTIETAFPGVVNHRQILTNATTNSKASGWSWYDSKVELMNEVMLYGSVAWGEATYNSGYNVGSSHGRLPLFALRQDMVNIRQTYWLRDVISAAFFARASHDGDANYNDASGARGVRPAFSIS